VNARIRLVALASLGLLVALVLATSYWQAWAAPDLAERRDNSIRQMAEYAIKRGRILAADGHTALAVNHSIRRNNKTYYYRRYPLGALTAAAVGYSTVERSRTGLERSANDYLTGADRSLASVLNRERNRLLGSTITGSDVVASINLRAQRAAMSALDGNCGAAVAIEPATGRVLVLASRPSYNPNDVEHHFARIKRIRSNCSPAAPLLDRATQGLYPPGSAFKVVTAAAALDSGTYTPDSTFYDPGYCVEYGQQVHNFADQSGPHVYGTVSLFQALEYSVNSVFCNVGMKLGAHTIMDYARRFGFDSKPPLDTPENERRTSGLYSGGRLLPAQSDGRADPGRLAFGQDKLLVTPLQMAMVAATIANAGVMMRPHLVERIVRPNGSVDRIKPQSAGRVIKAATAYELSQMMQAVVSGGTGTAAALPGIAVAGKTGTAEMGPDRPNTAWFIAFAPADHPRVAVAVALENQSGTGGMVAAPVARAIMQALLQPGANS
jgi:peptidoglycan glycosyltransferase